MAPSTAITLLVLVVAVTASPPPSSRYAVEEFCPEECTCDVYPNIIQADCSARSLSDIPSSFHFTTNKLILDDNVLVNLQPNAFQNLENLKTFNCARCKIEHIDNDAFLGLNNLKVIDLSSNKFKHISIKPFRELKHLRVLILEGNDELDCDAIHKDFHDLSPYIIVQCGGETLRTKRTPTDDDRLQQAFVDDVFTNTSRDVDTNHNGTNVNNTRSLADVPADAGGEWVPIDTPEEPGGWGAGTWVVLAILILIICLVCFKFVFLRLRKRYKRRAREAAWRAEDEENDDA